MIRLNENARNILQSYIDKYVDYRQKGEYGTSAFWNWYYQVRREMLSLDKQSQPIGQNLTYTMKYWGYICYSKEYINNEVFVYVTGFKFNQNNFKRWLQHKNMNGNTYSVQDVAFGGYTAYLDDNSQKYGIFAPNKAWNTKPVFDDVINFHHSMEDYNKIHAIGFIGNRVYSILPNGNISLLHMSKTDYLSMKHRYDESRRKRLKAVINEAVSKVLRRYTA